MIKPKLRSKKHYAYGKNEAVKLKESARAVGLLLGFYRRKRNKSQKDLALSAGVYPSEIGMYESGSRLPSCDTLQRLGPVLGLDPFELRQLQTVAGHLNPANAPGDEWLAPDDILLGVPMFLRRFQEESRFQSATEISETWIVANMPLALKDEMYEMLKAKVLDGKTTFVYFLGGDAAEENFQALWSRLHVDLPKLKSVIPDRVQCVLAPASLCLYHFAICNPGQQSRMFGRAVMYQHGLPIGVYAMDTFQVHRAHQLLAPAYELCRTRGEVVRTDYGCFQLVKPRQL